MHALKPFAFVLACLVCLIAAPADAQLGCNSAGKYCSGTFDELIYRVRYTDTGWVDIWLQPAAIASIQSTGHCPLFNDVYVRIRPETPHTDRLLAQITVARALGTRLRLDWATGPSGSCEVYRIFDPY